MSSHHHDRDGDEGNGRGKRAKLASSSGEATWLPAGISVVIAPVYSPKNKDAKFAFPADLVYENLGALLGIVENPWTDSPKKVGTTTQDKIFAVTKTKTILRDLCITPEMCRGYVEYCRSGDQSKEALAFLNAAAAPKEMYDRYIFEKKTERLKFAISNQVESLGDKYYTRVDDTVRFFAEWVSSARFVSPPLEKVNLSPDNENEGHHVILYHDASDIDALRHRIRKEIWKNDVVKKALSDGMRQTILQIMRDQTLRCYGVQLLGDEEEE